MPKWEVNKIVDSLLESITEELQQGEEVYLKEFGRFELRVRTTPGANLRNLHITHIHNIFVSMSLVVISPFIS